MELYSKIENKQILKDEKCTLAFIFSYKKIRSLSYKIDSVYP